MQRKSLPSLSSRTRLRSLSQRSACSRFRRFGFSSGPIRIAPLASCPMWPTLSFKKFARVSRERVSRRSFCIIRAPGAKNSVAQPGATFGLNLSVQMFSIHLSALDLDFHPVRSKSRHTLQTVITALTSHIPEPSTPRACGNDAGMG